MPIERYQRPLDGEERARLERELAFVAPEAAAVRFRKERAQALLCLFVVGLVHLALTYGLTRLDIPTLLAFGCLTVILFIVYGLVYEHCRRVVQSYKPNQVQSDYQELLSERENNRRYGWRVSAMGCVALWSLNGDVCWLFQTEANRVLLLDRWHFYWIKSDYPPAEFLIDDAREELDPLVRGLAEPLVPRAQIVLEGYVPAFAELPVVYLPDTPEVAALKNLNSGDLFEVSLDEVLQKAQVLLNTRTGNLWETEQGPATMR